MNDAKTNQPPLSEVLHEVDVNSLPQPQLTGHMWRQEGTQLICQSCSFKHATFIDPGYQLYGIDEKGHPMIRKVDVKNSVWG